MADTMPKFHIDTAEYEQERDVFDMCRWINATLAEMEKVEGFDTIYYERKGLNVKKLLEEALPIACLGLHFFRPATAISIQCLAGNQPYDALLRITNSRGDTTTVKVEATTVEHDQSVWRRQVLSREGTWMSGPMTKIGRDITCSLEMEDVEERHDEWVELALSSAARKLEKRSAYGSDTAILVYIDMYFTMPIRIRAELIRKTHDMLKGNRDDIFGVYYCHRKEFLVDGVRLGRTPR